MRIAYLIMAYDNYDHLQRLINALNCEGVSFYIHIDKRSKMPALEGDNIFFVERINSYWSTFNCIRAELNLLRKAIESGPFDYFVLLSGADYPIVSNRKIKERLKEGGQFIWIQQHFGQTPLSYYKYYYFNIERRSVKWKTWLAKKIEYLVRKCKVQKKIPFDLYVGATWFALSRDCVQFILNELQKNKRYVNFFRNSRFPEEAFFLTIIGNSPFFKERKHFLTYCDWSDIDHPALITEAHIGLFSNHKEYVFARKFNDKSAEIVDLIDRELRRE